jgi:hypothetical protein
MGCYSRQLGYLKVVRALERLERLDIDNSWSYLLSEFSQRLRRVDIDLSKTKVNFRVKAFARDLCWVPCTSVCYS